jgi:murein DD-endopeptidase MepM/ murein hydrolase activator NlpD
MEDLANQANQNIDFNTAINSGNFDEAAKIRNDMQAQAASNALDAQEARAAARVQKTVDRLQKKIDNLEKMRDKELKNLSALEDRQKKHLEKMQQQQSDAQSRAQQAEQDALQKREDADMASMQKTRDYEEAMLNQRLDLFKTYIAKNQKDLERWMHHVGLTYDDFGSDIKAKGESWASYFQKSLRDHILQAGAQVQSDKMWDAMGPRLARKLLSGLGFKTLSAFQKFVNTGTLTQQQRGGGSAHTGGHTVQHGGGMVGGMYGQNNRKGIRGPHGGLSGSERMVLAQKGEFIVNKRSATRHRSLLEQINNAGTGGFSGGVAPISGQMAAYMAGGWQAGTRKSVQRAMKQARRDQRRHQGGGKVGGYVPGPGGRHRPTSGPVSAYNGMEGGFNSLDIATPIGTKAYAVGNGTVVTSTDIKGYEPRRMLYGRTGPSVQDGYRSYGRYMVLALDGGGAAIYAHLSQRGVAAGKHVAGGSVIGRTGNTGNVQSSSGNGAHLHFGTHPMSPYAFLRKGGTVRFDNTPAMLHRGETVLTDNLTKKFKENVASGGNTVYDVDVTVTGSDLNPDDVAEAVIKKIERQERRGPTNRRNKN